MNYAISVALVANTAGFGAGLSRAAAELKGFERQAQASSLGAGKIGAEAERGANRAAGAFDGLSRSAAKPRASFDGLARGAALAGGAMLAGFGVAAAATLRFDKQLSELGAVSQATGAEMASLRQAALDAGAATSFSATEAAQAQTELAKAGVSVADIMGGGLTGALSLAEAGQLDLGRAAEIAANAMATFKLEGEDVGHIADVLAAAANKSAGDVEGFAQGLQQTGLVASQFGLSLEDTVGTLAAFAQAGLKGSDAGTSMKTMLSSFVPKSVEAANEMDRLGLSFFDAQGNFVGIESAAEQLQTRLAGLTQEQRVNAMQTIFGSDAIRAATVLYDEGGEGVKRWSDNVNQSGTAAEMARAKMDNLAGDLEELKGSIETALIQGGSAATSALRGLAQGATSTVNAFSDLPRPVQTGAIAILGIGGAALTAVGGLGVLIPKMQAGTAAVKSAAAAAQGLTVWTTMASNAQGLALRVSYLGDALYAVFSTGNLKNLSGFRTAFSGLSGAITSALTSPVALAAGAAAAVYLFTTAMNDAEQAAKEMRKEVEADLDTLSFQSIADTADDVNAKLRETGKIVDDYGRGGSVFDQLTGSLKGAVEVLGPWENKLAEAAEAEDEMGRAARDLETAQAGLGDALRILGNDFGITGDRARELLESMDFDPVDWGAFDSDEIRQFTSDVEEATAMAQEATPAQQGVADAVSGVTEATATAEDQVNAFSDALEAMIGISLGAWDAETKYAQGIQGLTESLKDNGLTMDAWTEKGQANRSALSEAIVGAKDYAEAIMEQTGSQREAANHLSVYREQLINTAVGAGMARGEAEELINSLGLAPDDISTLFTMENIDESQAKVQALQAAATALQGYKVGVPIELDDLDFLEDAEAVGEFLAFVKAAEPQAIITLNDEPFKATAEQVEAWSEKYADSTPEAKALLDFADPLGKFDTLSELAANWDEAQATADMFANNTPAQTAIFDAMERLALWDVSVGEAQVYANQGPAAASIASAKDNLAGWGRSSATGTVLANNTPALGRIRSAKDSLGAWGRSSGSASVNARDNASGTLYSVSSLLGSLDGRTSTVTIRTVQQHIVQEMREIFPATRKRWGGIVEMADGGVIAAAGGFDWRTAQVVQQPTVLFGERETGGEAYVPRNGDPRRSTSILEEAASWYGLSVIPDKDAVAAAAGMALGASMPVPDSVVAPQMAMAGGGGTVVNNRTSVHVEVRPTVGVDAMAMERSITAAVRREVDDRDMALVEQLTKRGM